MNWLVLSKPIAFKSFRFLISGCKVSKLRILFIIVAFSTTFAEQSEGAFGQHFYLSRLLTQNNIETINYFNRSQYIFTGIRFECSDSDIPHLFISDVWVKCFRLFLEFFVSASTTVFLMLFTVPYSLLCTDFATQFCLTS